MFITMQLTLFLANNMEFVDATVVKFLCLRIFIPNKFFSLFISCNFFSIKRNFYLICFYLICLNAYIINRSSMFFFFFWTRCLTEIVSSQSNTYSSLSLSNDQPLFSALLQMFVANLLK